MLVKYEFLKILRKKSTIIVMIVSLLITAFLFSLPVIQYQTYNQDGAIKGTDGIAYTKELYKDISVPLTEEYVTKTIKDVQILFENSDNVGTDGNEQFIIGNVYWSKIAPKEKLLNIIAKNYAAPNESVGYNSLPNVDVSNGAKFYDAMQTKFDAQLNLSNSSMTDEQKEYWSNMANKIDSPLHYGYYEGWETIINSFELIMFAILAICIIIAPVFSGEYQAGTDAVILSGKLGKTKLIKAKIIASLLFGTLAFVLHIAVACGIPLIAFGTDGYNLPIQIANTTIPYPFTFLQVTLINIGVIYLMLLGMIGVTLLLSSKMKSPYIVLTILVPVLFIPMFLSPNGSTGLYNLVLFLLPYRVTSTELGKFVSYQFGNVVLNVWSVRAIIYSVLTVIMLPLAKLGFKNHQVL